MRFIIFTDPRYHAERHVDLDPADIVSAEEGWRRLLLGGKHRVTVVKLNNGLTHTVAGEVKAQIEAARRGSTQHQSTQ